jgi:hypothetical protein
MVLVPKLRPSVWWSATVAPSCLWTRTVNCLTIVSYVLPNFDWVSFGVVSGRWVSRLEWYDQLFKNLREQERQAMGYNNYRCHIVTRRVECQKVTTELFPGDSQSLSYLLYKTVIHLLNLSREMLMCRVWRRYDVASIPRGSGINLVVEAMKLR